MDITLMFGLLALNGKNKVENKFAFGDIEMSITLKDNLRVRDIIIGEHVLDDVIIYIADNLEPDDVFTVSQLEDWAFENGFTLDED